MENGGFNNVEYLHKSEGDVDRHKAYCVFRWGNCIKRNCKCPGSAHCLEYSTEIKRLFEYNYELSQILLSIYVNNIDDAELTLSTIKEEAFKNYLKTRIVISNSWIDEDGFVHAKIEVREEGTDSDYYRIVELKEVLKKLHGGEDIITPEIITKRIYTDFLDQLDDREEMMNKIYVKEINPCDVIKAVGLLSLEDNYYVMKYYSKSGRITLNTCDEEMFSKYIRII